MEFHRRFAVSTEPGHHNKLDEHLSLHMQQVTTATPFWAMTGNTSQGISYHRAISWPSGAGDGIPSLINGCKVYAFTVGCDRAHVVAGIIIVRVEGWACTTQMIDGGRTAAGVGLDLTAKGFLYQNGSGS